MSTAKSLSEYLIAGSRECSRRTAAAANRDSGRRSTLRICKATRNALMLRDQKIRSEKGGSKSLAED